MFFSFFLGQVLQDPGKSFFHYRLTSEDRIILDSYFPYYSRLLPRFQKVFRDKLEMILSTREFIARGGLTEVTAEMKVLIGATIVQVTFGWEGVALNHFQKILIYPNTYYSTISKNYHKGEVNPRFGIIVLSWPHFLRGLADENDGVNLGIHEVAHALKLENQIQYNGESSFFNPGIWNEYMNLAMDEIEKLQNGINLFFRERGGVDSHEFFAVVLENFFERPEDFRSQKPDLYRVLVLLLRQDPIKLKSNRS